MKFLAFTVALLVAALPATPVFAKHDDPVEFSKYANAAQGDIDQLPHSKGTSVGDVLGFRGNDKKPGGLGSIRVTTGGKPEAWSIFAAATSQIKADGANVINNYVDVDLTDQINGIICTLEFDKDNIKNKDIRKLHYQEHRATGLAWLQYEFVDHTRHRIIFLARTCPYGPYAGSVNCTNSPNEPANAPNYIYPPGPGGPAHAAQYCTDKLKYTFTSEHKEFGDGGGGGEM